MANHSYVFLILILFSLGGACSPDEIDDTVVFYWEQTKCSDPWGTTGNDSQSKTRGAIISFLTENGIYYVNVVNFEDTISNGVNCDACICPTEIDIIVEVNEKYDEEMDTLGFKRK